jgi:hypothetical protein
MSNKRTAVEIKTTGPSYLEWRGKLLTELALARVPELIVYKSLDHPPYDFLAATAQGFCFFVNVKAFSSFHLDVADVETVPELRWSLDADLVRRAHASHSPVLLFLFDADTGHGRYLRLDTFPAPATETRRLTVRLPVEHTINKESLEKLIADLQGTSKSCRA